MIGALRFVRACAVGAVLLAVAPPTPAQVEYREPIVLDDRELAGFARIFAATDAQREAAQALAAAAYAEAKAAEAKAGQIASRWRALPPEERTPHALQRLLVEMWAAEPDMDALRRRVLADLRAILTEQQAARWPRFERFLRRERVLFAPSGWERDRTNLLALVDQVGLDEATRAALEPLLEQYERELDALLARLETEEARMNERLRQATGEDYDAIRREATAPFFAVAVRLRQFNRDYARRFAAAMPDEAAQAFRDLARRARLPEAYGPWPDHERLLAAPDLPGLDEETRQSVRAVVDSYRAKYDELTRQIAAMEERAGEGKPVSQTPGEWDEVRMNRGSLVASTWTRLESLLTEEQRRQVLRAGERRAAEWRSRMSR